SAIYAGTVHPGRYLVLVAGDTASVEVALETGRDTGADSVIDSIFLPAVHDDVVTAIVSSVEAADFDGDACGIVETDTVASIVEAADAGVKAAAVSLPAVRLADGLGGKGYAVFTGPIADVEEAVGAAVERSEPTGHLVRHVIIAQIHDEMRQNLAEDLRFNQRLARHSGDR
ncbi:MAG: BMC domain-containing protein, partial [Acidimicrobiia bacterium]|nr:BMC domain-containing protein [Acidimicrobiia bacterium]